MSHDYFRELDLNPMVNGAPAPINNPLDPRALHYFGFLSTDQEISFGNPSGGSPRVLVSFHYGNQPTAAPPAVQPPIDGVLDFSGGPPVVQRLNHDRAHVLVWLDPAISPPPTGPVIVRVSARSRQ